MYCSVCGNPLPREMKYCNSCGALLRLGKDPETKTKRLDDYVDGTFWTTLIGLGIVLGGVISMKALELPLPIIIGWAIVSSIAFLIIFSICLWQIILMSRKPGASEAPASSDAEEFDTNKLAGQVQQPRLAEPQSVVEDSTRQFEPSSERK